MKFGKMSAELLAFAAISLTGCKACTEQHNPNADHEKFEDERTTANQSLPELKEDGSLPEKPKESSTEASADTGAKNSAGAKKYAQFCTPCHGASGAADGATAAAMNPKPRNFTDAAWQESVDDARIAKVIKEGGAAVGLSPTMPPWGAVVNDEEVTQIVELIRSFKK